MSDDDGPLETILGGVGAVVGIVVTLVAIAVGLGVTAGVTGVLWLVVLMIVDQVVGLPTVTLGVAEAVGLPAVVNGVPLLYAGVLGLVSSVVFGALSSGDGTASRPATYDPLDTGE